MIEGQPDVTVYPTALTIPEDNSDNYTMVLTAQPTITITVLTLGNSYEVQMRAKNVEGTGAWSPSGEGTPQKSADLPFIWLNTLRKEVEEPG